MTQPGRPRLDDPTESSFSVNWDPVPGAVEYRLYVREYPKEWSTAEMFTIKETKVDANGMSGEMKKMIVEDRFPTSTYQLRVVAVFEDGRESPPSEEATIDTAVGNCVPKGEQEKRKCIVM